MKILALERESPMAEKADFEPHLQAEAQQIWALQQAGHLREIYFHVEQHTAVLILECEDAAASRRLLDDLPLVQAGLIDFEIWPLAPYSGFERLFAAQN